MRIRDVGSAFAPQGGALACLADLNLSCNQLSGCGGLAHLQALAALNLNGNRCGGEPHLRPPDPRPQPGCCQAGSSDWPA
jgi:hypothetical protein